MGTVAAAVALGAADEDVAQELHLDFFESGAAAFFALALTGVEAEGAAVHATLFGELGLGEEIAERIKSADVNGGVAARCSADGGLVDHNGAAERLPTGQAARSLRGGLLAIIFFFSGGLGV